MAAAVADADVVTDDRPLLEHAHQGMRAEELPRALFDVSSIDAWCPRCLGAVPDLRQYLSVRSAIYRSPAFRDRGGLSFEEPEVVRVINAHESLRFLIEGEGYHLQKLAARHLEHGDLTAALAAYERALHLRPNDPDALFGIARVRARQGDGPAADELIDRVVAIAPQHPGANGVLCLRALNRGDADGARKRCEVAMRGGVAMSPQLVARLRELTGSAAHGVGPHPRGAEGGK
jgi:tetratricopeptide (TPR) repeat protein